MAFVCLGQSLYISDSVWFEESILTTMDITTDGFGYMLIIGDLVWVPFTYTMQARYLAQSAVEINGLYLIGLVLLFLGSYATFRGSNSQKNTFRTLGSDHPSVCKSILTGINRLKGCHLSRLKPGASY
jgi:delta14-sterol reductase